VALDVTISEELRNEGIARELVNRIQNLRKDSGFEVTDKITVAIQKNGILENAITDTLENYIKTETLTEKIDLLTTVSNGIDIAFDDIETKLFIEKI
jgi:isoleucyl-tRNA synthetase